MILVHRELDWVPKKKLITPGMLWMSYAYGATLLLQGAYFVLLARTLGPASFGLFAAALALVSLASPFVGFGAGNTLVMRASVDSTLLGAQYGTALIYIIVSGSVSVAIAVALGVLFPFQLSALFVPLVVSELVFAKLAEVAGQVFQASERLHGTAHISVGMAAGRVLSVGIVDVLISGRPSAENWAYFYMAVSVGAGVITVAIVLRSVCRPTLSNGSLRADWRLGIFFSLGQASKTAYGDIDKLMLNELISSRVSGFYTAGYRIESMAFAPIQAIVFSNNTTFYRAARAGASQLRLAYRSLFRPILVYGLIVGLLMLATSPLLPIVLGSEYGESGSVMIWLSALPVIQGFHYLLSDTLMAMGRQVVRSLIQLATAFLNVGLNFWLIPHYSWHGAVAASYVSELMLLFLIFRSVRSLGPE